MNPGEFLRSVWPSKGIFCLATRKGKGFVHHLFDHIDDAAAAATRMGNTEDVFFNIHVLAERSIIVDGKTKVRAQANMRAARCFFFDLDVGPEDSKYNSQAEALADLKRFCQEAQLPKPLITSSGGGIHVYWPISDELSSNDWWTTASKLRQLTIHHAFRADPMRTTDTSSLLRVVGTWNYKQPVRREVQALMASQPTPTGVFVKLVDDALIRAGMQPTAPPKFRETLLGSNTKMEFSGPPVSLRAVVTECAQMARMVQSQGAVSEPEWYQMLNIVRFVENGDKLVHKVSEKKQGTYTAADVDSKIKQLQPFGPSSCLAIAGVSKVGDLLCETCPHAGHVKNPLMAARYKDPAPAPAIEQILGSTTITTTIPDPPAPFTRMKGGGIAYVAKNKDGDEINTIIYENDLYPVRRLVNTSASTEQQLWRVELPRGESRDFMLDADALYDTKKFMLSISNNGIYPAKAHITYLQDYMVAYISELQRLTDADTQCSHLGWSDDRNQFILPDKIMSSDGGIKPANLSLGAQRSSLQVHKKGTLQRQVELLHFYDGPAYVPNRFFILSGLAAPLFHMTGQYGMIVNASGDSGASKSTSLYTAASFWGSPSLYPINGTDSGATVRGRNERVTVLANLPICVDEITHMQIKDAVDLAMSVTQPGHRIRLENSGVERAAIGSHKSTIMLTTANNSLHNSLSIDNNAGTAGSMRVFEIHFRITRAHQKHEADEYLHELKENYGHIGELVVAYVLKNREKVESRVRTVMKEIDLAAKIQASERFWSADIAVVIVVCEIANELNLLSWDPAILRKWALTEQIPTMRGVVQEEYSDPLATLSNYLEHINNNILIVNNVNHHGGSLVNIQHDVHGALLGHYDTDHKTLWVLKKGFKDYCSRIGANSTKIVSELFQPQTDAHGNTTRVISNKETRKVLGSGTHHAKSQTWCFTINMSHPDVSGIVDLSVVTGGSPGGGSAGGKASLHTVR